MRTKSFLFVSSVLVLASTGFAQTQRELEADASAAFAAADARLNEVYKEAMGELDEAKKAALRDAQRAWIPYRDAVTNAAAAMYEGGTLAASASLGKTAEVTRERVYHLERIVGESQPNLDARENSELRAAVEAMETRVARVAADLKKQDTTGLDAVQQSFADYRGRAIQAERAIFAECGERCSLILEESLLLCHIEHLKGLFYEVYEERLTAEAASSTAEPKPAVVLNGIGDVKIGMTREEIERAWHGRLVEMPELGSGAECYCLSPADDPSGLRLWVVSGKLGAVEVRGQGYRTRSGVGVGNTREKLLATYPGRLEDRDYAGYFFVPKDAADAQYIMRFISDSDGSIASYLTGLRALVELNAICWDDI